jgi:hypothetical protein
MRCSILNKSDTQVALCRKNVLNNRKQDSDEARSTDATQESYKEIRNIYFPVEELTNYGLPADALNDSRGVTQLYHLGGFRNDPILEMLYKDLGKWGWLGGSTYDLSKIDGDAARYGENMQRVVSDLNSRRSSYGSHWISKGIFLVGMKYITLIKQRELAELERALANFDATRQERTSNSQYFTYSNWPNHLKPGYKKAASPSYTPPRTYSQPSNTYSRPRRPTTFDIESARRDLSACIDAALARGGNPNDCQPRSRQEVRPYFR